MLQMDVVLELDLKLYQETVSELLQDVYTPKKQAVLVSSPKIAGKPSGAELFQMPGQRPPADGRSAE